MVADPVKRVKVDEATQAKGATEDSTAKRHKRGKKNRGKKKGIDAGMSASAAGTSAAEIEGYLEVATASSNCSAAQRPCADTLHVPYRAACICRCFLSVLDLTTRLVSARIALLQN